MSHFQLIFVLALLVPFATCFAEAEPELDGGAVQVAANLVSVASCTDPMRNESYRVVVFSQGFEHVSSVVYLQWLEWGEDGPQLIKSVPVTELSTGMWSIGSSSVMPAKACSIQLNASHTYSAESARFFIRPLSLGHYSFRRSSKVRIDP